MSFQPRQGICDGERALPAAAALGGANFLQSQRLLRRGGARRAPEAAARGRIVLTLEGKMTPAVTTTEAANQEMRLSSR